MRLKKCETLGVKEGKKFVLQHIHYKITGTNVHTQVVVLQYKETCRKKIL